MKPKRSGIRNICDWIPVAPGSKGETNGTEAAVYKALLLPVYIRMGSCESCPSRRVGIVAFGILLDWDIPVLVNFMALLHWETPEPSLIKRQDGQGPKRAT